MNITNDIKPVTYLKSKAALLLNQVNETHRPVIITQNGEPRAVLQDPESYENMRNAIGLLKLISQGESDVRDGKFRSQEDVFKDLENSLREKIKSKASSRYAFPERGRIVPELQEQGISQYRELAISPWRLVYRIAEKEIYVLSLFDSR